MYSTRAFCKKRPEFGHCVSKRRNVIALWHNVTSWRHIHGDGCLQTPVVYDYPFNLLVATPCFTWRWWGWIVLCETVNLSRSAWRGNHLLSILGGERNWWLTWRGLTECWLSILSMLITDPPMIDNRQSPLDYQSFPCRSSILSISIISYLHVDCQPPSSRIDNRGLPLDCQFSSYRSLIPSQDRHRNCPHILITLWHDAHR